jgi:diguanylate cyclase (GGDEF)-like protein
MEPTSRVLIVDDEDSNLDMLSRRLSRCGYSVLTASDGAQAMQILKQSHVDLVLLDQMMPGMTGLDVLREIRSMKSVEKLPVIMVTAVSDSFAIAEALDLGANDYVTKPLDFQVALARIRTQLALGREDNKVRRSEERHALAARGSGEGLWDWDIAADTIYCTPESHRLAGFAPREDSYRPGTCFARVHPSDRLALRAIFANSAAQPRQHETMRGTDVPEPGTSNPEARDEIAGEFRFRHASRRYRWFSLRGVTLRNVRGAPVRYVGSITDVTAPLTIDTLTGLANKRLLQDEIDAAIHRHRKDSALPYCVFLFDIDHFKLLKPTLARSTRQLLLVLLAERIQKVIDEFVSDTNGRSLPPPILARLSEDEFGILLHAVQSEAEAEELARRLSRSMRPAFALEDRDIFCSVSIGIAFRQPAHRCADDVLRDASTAMFAAGFRGVGKWLIFEDSMRKLRDQRLQMDIDLRLGLERQQFEVYYQSRVHLETGVICGFEALVRWNHPVRGIISPLEFIPIAEENGLIHEIGLWVLERACTQTQEWRQRFNLDSSFEVSVNLSPRQCREPHLVKDVADILRRTGLPPSSLNLELTESLLMEDMDQAKLVLQSLKDLGVGLKIDDFGTGYSCLKYLCEFPFDSLKIDRSFTKDLDQSSIETEEIVRTILQMAGNLKMEVVAEGVETMAHVARLQALGCKYGQGFLFSRPISAAEVELLLELPPAGGIDADRTHEPGTLDRFPEEAA